MTAMTAFDIKSIVVQPYQAERSEAEHLSVHPSQPAVSIPSQGIALSS